MYQTLSNTKGPLDFEKKSKQTNITKDERLYVKGYIVNSTGQRTIA